MERAGLEAEIKKLIVETLMLEDVTPEEIDSVEPLFGDGLALDSIDALELALALEGRYGWASAKTARKLCQGIDFVGGSCSLSLLISLQNSSDAPSAVLAIGLLSFTLACASFGTAGYWVSPTLTSGRER